MITIAGLFIGGFVLFMAGVERSVTWAPDLVSLVWRLVGVALIIASFLLPYLAGVPAI